MLPSFILGFGRPTPLFEEASGGADGGGVVAAPPPATSGDSAPSASPETSSDFGPGGGRSVTEGSDAFSDVVAHATREESPRIPQARIDAVQRQLNGPQAPPPSAPQAPGAAQAPVVGQPAAVQQPPAAPAQAQPQQYQASPQQMQHEAAVYQQKRNATIAELEKAYGQFTEDEKLQLMTEPHLILPRMLARAQTDALEYTIRSVAQMIPQLTHATIQQNIQEHAALETFYGHFPELRSHPAGTQTIWEIGNAYIRANPHADAQTRMRDIGLLAKARLGLLAPAAQQPQAAAPQPQPMPLLPPYTPAGVGGSAVPSGPPADRLAYLDDILPLRRI